MMCSQELFKAFLDSTKEFPDYVLSSRLVFQVGFKYPQSTTGNVIYHFMPMWNDKMRLGFL